MSGAIWRAHLRLALRSWGFWIVALGALGLVYAAVRGGSLSRMFYNFNELAAPLFYLGQMLLTTAAAQRERSERVEELIEALPYGTIRWVLVRFLVHYALWLGVSLLLWSAGGALVALAGQPLDIGLLALNWAAVAPVTLAFTTGAAFVIGALAERGVLAYFLTVAVWITGPFSIILISKSSPNLPMPLGEYFASGRAFPLTATGYFVNGGLLLYNRLFALGVAGAVLGLLLWVRGRRRRVPVPAAVPALVLFLLLAAGSAGAEYQVWYGRQDAHDRETAEVMAASARTTPAERQRAMVPVREQGLRTDRYQLDLTLEPRAHRLAATGQFDVTNLLPGAMPLIELTLRSSFQVESVADSSGRALPFTREFDRLVIDAELAPGATQRLAVKWSGVVWEWRMDNGWNLGAHIAPESILLPAHHGWYPLPGRQTLRRQLQLGGTSGTPSVMDEPVTHFPAAFALTVQGSSLNLIHNAGPDTTGLFLVGTPFETVRSAGMELTVSHINRVQAEGMAGELADLITYYEAVIPRGGAPLHLIELHDSSSFGSPWGRTGSEAATPGALLIKNVELGRFYDGYFSRSYPSTIVRIWWPGDTGDRFQIGLYQAATQYMVAMRSPGRTGAGHPILALFQAVEAAKGQEAVIAILRELHALLPQGGPTVEDFERAVLKAAGGTPNLDLPNLLGKVRRWPKP